MEQCALSLSLSARVRRIDPPSRAQEFLEVNFPLRRAIPGQPATMAKVKVENPIPGLEKELPKGARFERGGPQYGGAGAGAGAGAAAGETPVSVVQLAKRVAADQLGLCVQPLPPHVLIRLCADTLRAHAPPARPSRSSSSSSR